MKLEHLIEKHYGIRVHSMARVREGVGGEVCIADADVGRFICKGTASNDLRARNEPRIVEYAARQGIPVPEYLPLKDGGWFFRRGKKQYNLRPYVLGTVYGYNEAPAWLPAESAWMLGKIHAAMAG